MKTLRFFGMALLMVLCAVNFAACSDDENYTELKITIVGSWRLTTNTGFIHTNVTFTENGKCSYTSTEDTGYEEHGDYKIIDDILYQMASDENDWEMSKILLLNEETLTLQDLEDDGVTFTGKPYSYKRIK